MSHPSLDDLRTAFPKLGFAVYAMEPGKGVTFEVHEGGHVYTFKGATEAEAIMTAFPPPPTEPPAQPVNVFD